MKSKMIWANFSVKDFKRTNEFYTKLGFKPNGRNDYPQLASYVFGDDNFVIHFFEEGSRIGNYIGNGTGEIIFTLSAETEEEVNGYEALVKAAGGSIFQPAGRDALGYYGFGFADPDGHKFNVLLMEEGM